MCHLARLLLFPARFPCVLPVPGSALPLPYHVCLHVHFPARCHQPGPGTESWRPRALRASVRPLGNAREWWDSNPSPGFRRGAFPLQLDWYGWVPNAPCTMRMPPPTSKDGVTMETVMGSLPDAQKACLQMTITWHLGRLQPDMVSQDPGPCPGRGIRRQGVCLRAGT